MSRLGPLFSAIGAGSRSLDADAQRKKQEQQRLEDRIAEKEMRDLEKRRLEDMLNRPAPEPTWETKESDEGYVQINPRTGEVRKLGVKAPPKAEPLEVVIGADGSRTYTPRSQAAGAKAPSPAPKPEQGPEQRKPAEFEKKAAFMLEGAEAAHKALEGYRAPARSFVRQVPGLGNYGMTPEDQVAAQAAETMADAYLRLTTGATITPEEVKNTARQMVPQPGDGESVLAAKKARREQVLRAIRQAAQVAQPDAAPARGGKVLSPSDAAKAKADPGFAQWLRSQGYEVP